MPSTRISLSRERIISDFLALGFSLASRDSLLAKASAPTAVSCTRPRPATTMLPERRMSPGRWVTASASPVIRDSSSHSSPCRRMPSAQSWSPWANSAMSSRRISSGGTSMRFPSRITVTGRSATRASRSTARLARISWTMPMTVLMAATIRNPIFSTLEPLITSSVASTRKIRLKKVKQWPQTISPGVFPEGWGFPLTSPTSSRCVTCSWVRPTSGSAQIGAMFCLCSIAPSPLV